MSLSRALSSMPVTPGGGHEAGMSSSSVQSEERNCRPQSARPLHDFTTDFILVPAWGSQSSTGSWEEASPRGKWFHWCRLMGLLHIPHHLCPLVTPLSQDGTSHKVRCTNHHHYNQSLPHLEEFDTTLAAIPRVKKRRKKAFHTPVSGSSHLA